MLFSKIHHFNSIGSTFGILILVCFIGCFGSGEPLPELAKVTGTVTLDGKPLEGAIVSFTPLEVAEKGRGKSSSGGTDAEGKFQLMYNTDTPGAIIGEHRVLVNKLDGNMEDAGPEMIPARYNINSEITKTVTKSDPNEFTIDLKSK